VNAQTKSSKKKITIKRGAQPKRAPKPPRPPGFEGVLVHQGNTGNTGMPEGFKKAAEMFAAGSKPETLEQIIARVSANGPKLFKVLVDGHGTHTSMPWHRPTSDAPGAWHEIDGELRLCSNGLHVTSYAAAWWKPEAQVYLAEVGDERVGDHTLGDRKCAARKVRLLRLATKSELAENGIFDGGTHDTRGGQSYAFNSAKVTAYDSAKVTAYDSAQVTASGSAKVTASGSAQVTAYDSAKVTAEGHCVVSVQVTYYNKPTIKLMGHAVAIQYEWGSAPTIRCASAATLVIDPAAESAESGKAA
jgi:hypothetical protein